MRLRIVSNGILPDGLDFFDAETGDPVLVPDLARLTIRFSPMEIPRALMETMGVDFDVVAEVEKAFADPVRATAIEIKAGDSLIIEVPQVLGHEVHTRLERIVQERFPGVKVLILEGGIKFTLATRPEDAAADAEPAREPGP